MPQSPSVLAILLRLYHDPITSATEKGRRRGIILRRLFSFTEHRTVGAVQWGGRYRIIDFMLSNMVNSGIYRIGVLMKDKYQSLIDHISNTKDWELSRKNSGVTQMQPYSYASKA